MSELIIGKVAVALLGMGIVAAGVWLMRFGDSITTALNIDYARPPFRFQYPPWWHEFMGALFVALGLLVAVAGILGRPAT